MSAPRHAFYLYSLSVALFCIVLFPPVLVYGQTPSTNKVGAPDDWSHHHLVFSDPGKAADSLARGRFERWYKVTHEPRYQLQQVKRSPEMRALAGARDFAARAALTSASINARSRAPELTKKQTLKRDWSMDIGGYAASQTGTFTASSDTGNVKVNGVTMTASAGTSATQSTTVSANGVESGDTITITNPLGNLSQTYTASTPIAEEDQIAFGATPGNNSSVTVVGIKYEFKTASWTSGNETTNECFILTSAITSNMVNWLADAITTGSANTGSSTTSWECGATASQGTSGATVTSSTSPDVDVTAKIVGSTGITTTATAASNITVTALTAGSDGSAVSPNFVWWVKNVAATAAAVATNIKNAITGTPVGVTTSGGSGIVILTAPKGLAGNQISVSTTIVSGLTGAAFNGNLGGGAAGTTSAAKFATSTDSTTQSTNLSNEATNLASAINTNVAAVTATANGAVVTVTDKTPGSAGNSIVTAGTLPTGGTFSWGGATLTGGATATVGAGIYPATYTYSSTGYCDGTSTPDFAVFNTGVVGGASQASIIAYDNLYSGCSGAVPLIYWQYNTAGTVVTSPVLSLDGSQVAFIQSQGTAAYLVILKWSESPTLATLAPLAPGSYPGCTAPCMTSVQFSPTTAFGAASATVPNDTTSSPFYDYYGDVIYVGDNQGYVHQFTGVFLGTPAETDTSAGSQSTAGWPVYMSPVALSNPIYDPVSGNIFVGPDQVSANNTGSFYSVPSGSPSSANEVTLTGLSYGGASGSAGIADGPVVDPVAGMVYAFVNDDGANANAAVWQFPTTFTAATIPVEVTLGQGSATGNLHIGQFDKEYYSSDVPTGNLYVCGRASASQIPTIYQVPITNDVLGAAVAGPGLTTGTTDCSPITEFYNGTTDYIFLSVEGLSQTAAPVSCPSNTTGCIMSFNVTHGAWSTSTTTTATLSETGGTSGIAVDNSLTTPTGASNVYFTPLNIQACTGNSSGTGAGTGGCAVQATQSGLN